MKPLLLSYPGTALSLTPKVNDFTFELCFPMDERFSCTSSLTSLHDRWSRYHYSKCAVVDPNMQRGEKNCPGDKNENVWAGWYLSSEALTGLGCGDLDELWLTEGLSKETDVDQVPWGLPPLVTPPVHQFQDRVLSRAPCLPYLSSVPRNQSQQGGGTGDGKLDRGVEGRRFLLATLHGSPIQLWETMSFSVVESSQ